MLLAAANTSSQSIEHKFRSATANSAHATGPCELFNQKKFLGRRSSSNNLIRLTLLLRQVKVIVYIGQAEGQAGKNCTGVSQNLSRCRMWADNGHDFTKHFYTKELQLAKWLFPFRLLSRTLGWNGNNFGFIAQLLRRVFNKILRLNKHLTEFTIALALETATLSDRTVWLIVIKRPRLYDLCRWLKLSTYRFARKSQDISKAGRSFFADLM